MCECVGADEFAAQTNGTLDFIYHDFEALGFDSDSIDSE
jgi:hypothetical protein